MDRGARRAPTPAEAKALSNPLRVRIMLLCARHELTNKQLADRLDRDPATVLYHVRQLVAAGLLEPAPVRSGASGALEKPYRSTGISWWLDGSLVGGGPEISFAPIQVFQEELRRAGPDSVATYATFALHLSAEDVATLDRRILDVLDEYILTDHERADRPLHNGIVVLHRLPE